MYFMHATHYVSTQTILVRQDRPYHPKYIPRATNISRYGVMAFPTILSNSKRANRAAHKGHLRVNGEVILPSCVSLPAPSLARQEGPVQESFSSLFHACPCLNSYPLELLGFSPFYVFSHITHITGRKNPMEDLIRLVHKTILGTKTSGFM